MSRLSAPPAWTNSVDWSYTITRRVAVVGLVMSAAPHLARATDCGSWDAHLTVTARTDHESKALDISWSAAPAPCLNGIPYGAGWPGVHHYEVVRTGDPGDPLDLATIGTYTSTGRVLNVSSTTYSGFDFVNRPDAWFGYRVYACQNASCTSWYGDDTGVTGFKESATDFYDHGVTEPEKWRLQGIEGEDDVDMGVVTSSTAESVIAPEAFFFPSDWGVNLSDHLVVYYSVEPFNEDAEEPTDPNEVWRLMWPDTGWETDGFNVNGGWGDELLVGEGATNSIYSDFMADHPWVMLTLEDTTKRIEMFVHSKFVPETGNDKITEVRSLGATGEDFGMDCSGSACADSYIFADTTTNVAVGALGPEDSDTEFVFGSRHGRILRSTLEHPYVEVGVDEPTMLFQVQSPPDGDCADNGNDDIGMADGAWDTDHWEWVVRTDGEGCPEIQIANGHDAGVVPLPGGAYKVFWKKYPYNPTFDEPTDYVNDQWYVSVWDGAAWATWFDSTETEVAASPIDFAWDDLSPGPDSVCVEDIAPFVRAEYGNFYDGMFFTLLDSDICGGTGFHDSNTGTDNALVFAVLAN